MYRFFKRVFDLLFSLIALIVFCMPMLILAILIKFDSKGPAIFKQERAGKNAKPFKMLKFRTMRTDVDPFGASPKSGEDSRLTGLGKFLREFSLDELPQILNVITGSMSIVGPRPLYIQQIPEWNDRQKRRLEVKPGLTGLAQISGRGALTREKKLELDVQYVEKCDFFMDTKIIWTTFLQVFKREKIYEERYSDDEITRNDNNPEQ